MDKNNLSDEKLVSLHKQKKINAFLTIYSRYKLYGYSIIVRTLMKTTFLNALKDDINAIFYESITDALNEYSKKKGKFRNLLSVIIERKTYKYISEFFKNPLSDYVSIDAQEEDSFLNIKDTLTFADRSPLPNERIDIIERYFPFKKECHGLYRRKIANMIRMRELGYSYQEIAEHYHTTTDAIRSAFYHLKRKYRK